MITRYVDDLNAVLRLLEPGVRYNSVEGKLELREELVEEDRGREKDELTMSVFGEIANSIDPDIDVEVDFPSNHDTKFMPILGISPCVTSTQFWQTQQCRTESRGQP